MTTASYNANHKERGATARRSAKTPTQQTSADAAAMHAQGQGQHGLSRKSNAPHPGQQWKHVHNRWRLQQSRNRNQRTGAARMPLDSAAVHNLPCKVTATATNGRYETRQNTTAARTNAALKLLPTSS